MVNCLSCRIAATLMAAAGMGAGTAHGATVSYVGPVTAQGTGFGNTLPVLVLHAVGSESGSVLRVGAVDLVTGDATNQSQTQPVSALNAFNITAANLALVFNIAEPGNATDVTLQGFTVRFTDNAGVTLFDAVFSQTQVLEQVAGGVGGSGHRYDIGLSPSEATSFFSNTTNRIGMFVNAGTPILNSAGGPDGFYLIPAPGTLGIGLAAMFFANRRQRRPIG